MLSFGHQRLCAFLSTARVAEGRAYHPSKGRARGCVIESHQSPFTKQPKLMDRTAFPPTSLLPDLGKDPILADFSPGQWYWSGDKAA